MSLSLNYPTIAPSLTLDFANTKQLDPRITFTRASTATFYNGITTAKAEENLVIRSQEFDNAGVWGPVNATITANATTAPDGTATAEVLTDNATNASHRVTQIVTGTVLLNTTYTYSVFLKAGTSNFGYLAFYDPTTQNRYITVDFNLSTGAVRASGAGTSGTLTASSITSVGNGWYRCTITGQLAAASRVDTLVGVSDGTTAIGTFGTIAYVGTGSTIEIWGAQVEQRSAVTAYTPTTTQPITNYIPVLQTAQNNVARFEHNPITGESLGLEIEEQRTNLLERSDDFANSYWSTRMVAATLQSNVVVAPDGTLTADRLTETTAANELPRFSWTQTIANTTVYTLSIYAKEDPTSAKRYLTLYSNFGFTGTPSYGCVFDLGAGTVTRQQNGFTGIITPVGNGWYRCSVITSASNATTAGLRIALQNGPNNVIPTNYTGDGYSGIFIWGAQLEAGAFPTSYIPTVASQVTRSPDVAVMTGTNFSSWYRADEGTFYVAASVADAETPLSQVFLDARSDGNNFLAMYIQASDGFLANNCVVGGVTQAQLGLVDLPNTQASFSNAFAYKVNDFAGVYNGAAPVTDTAGTVPAPTAIYIGNRGDLARPYNGTIRKLAYYPARLTNSQLQALTGL